MLGLGWGLLLLLTPKVIDGIDGRNRGGNRGCGFEESSSWFVIVNTEKKKLVQLYTAQQFGVVWFWLGRKMTLGSSQRTFVFVQTICAEFEATLSRMCVCVCVCVCVCG